MEIHNALLIGINKKLKLEKFNDENDPVTHIQGFEFNMEIKYGIKKNLKAKYFPMSLIDEA